MELQIMRMLFFRANLTGKEENHYFNLEKGYQGEKLFDEWIEPISDNRFVLHDFLFELNNTLCQIDTLFIASNTIYLFEIKNYDGDFLMDGDRWFTAKKLEIKNPLLQLKRTESLFRRLLQDLGSTIPVESYLVFVNPHFYLYQAQFHSPIIFPNQLTRFMESLQKKPSKLTETHRKLGKQLLSMHLDESPYSQLKLPTYEYGDLRKGVLCERCLGFYDTFNNHYLMCSSCGAKEDYVAAVLRNIEEFKMLFPDNNITTNQIHDWCNIIKTKKTIWTILSKHYKLVGHGKRAYYV